jgi:predicted DNA-binding antitoxin AbrB/MazE fold protein
LAVLAKFVAIRALWYTWGMTYEIRAIFDNGVLRPLEPLALGDQDLVTVVVRTQDAVSGDANELVLQREALKKMFAEADSLPNENPNDTFSGADHDSALYG